MATVKFGGGVTSMSGSIAGSTFARNRFGNYIRPRTKPVNPNSTGQSGVRSALSYLTQRWSFTLDATMRGKWNTYAAAIAMKNRLGETMYCTGFNHFLRSNIERKRKGKTVIDSGPTVLSLPEKDTTFAVTCSVGTGEPSAVFDNTLGWASETGGFFWVYMGQPQIHTRNFFNGPWKYMGVIPGVDAAPPTSPQTFVPPFPLVLGQRIWFYARISRKDGRISEAFIDDCVVVA